MFENREEIERMIKSGLTINNITANALLKTFLESMEYLEKQNKELKDYQITLNDFAIQIVMAFLPIKDNEKPNDYYKRIHQSAQQFVQNKNNYNKFSEEF